MRRPRRQGRPAEATLNRARLALAQERSIARLVRRQSKEWLGFDGAPGATRRFFRFAFAVRLLLLLATPLCFLIPGPDYAGSLQNWGVFVGLLTWTFLLGIATWVSDEYMKRTWWIRVVDVSIVFIAFVATTHIRDIVSASPSRGDVVIVGAFQLQTYGALVTCAALGGIGSGISLGLAAATAYLTILVTLGPAPGAVFAPAHVQGALLRTFLYLATGLAFGIFNVLVGSLVSARGHRESLDRAERALEAAHERAHQRVMQRLHDHGLNEIPVVRDVLADLSHIVSGDVKARIDNLMIFFDRMIVKLTMKTDEEHLAGRTVQDILHEVQVTSGLLKRTTHPVQLDLAEIGSQDDRLSVDEAHALLEILNEAIVNAQKHACDGVVQVRASESAPGQFSVEVRDEGPDVVKRPGSGRGLADIAVYVAERPGWEFNWYQGQHPGDPSILSLTVVVASADSSAQ